MQPFTIPTSVLAILLFGTITSGSPIPQDVPPPCIILPVIRTSYPASNLVTYNPSDSAIDGKLVYLPTRIGIPENPPPVPLVIYSDTVPSGTNLLTATLESSALYNQFSKSPAKVYPVSGTKGLQSVFYQSGFLSNPAGSFGKFQVTMGCDLKGKTREELWPASGRFCVRAGKFKPELELLIKSADYVEIKDDPNPCVDVTLVVKAPVIKTE